MPHELKALWQATVDGMPQRLLASVHDTWLERWGEATYLGARPGILATLHPWSQRLLLPPHRHGVVTGGGPPGVRPMGGGQHRVVAAEAGGHGGLSGPAAGGHPPGVGARDAPAAQGEEAAAGGASAPPAGPPAGARAYPRAVSLWAGGAPRPGPRPAWGAQRAAAAALVRWPRGGLAGCRAGQRPRRPGAPADEAPVPRAVHGALAAAGAPGRGRAGAVLGALGLHPGWRAGPLPTAVGASPWSGAPGRRLAARWRPRGGRAEGVWSGVRPAAGVCRGGAAGWRTTASTAGLGAGGRRGRTAVEGRRGRVWPSDGRRGPLVSRIAPRLGRALPTMLSTTHAVGDVRLPSVRPQGGTGMQAPEAEEQPIP